MNIPILSRSWKGWIVCLSLAVALTAVSPARATVIHSPDVNHTWTASMLDRMQYYWDAQTGFAVALTYTTQPFETESEPPQTETLLFHFPCVQRATVSGTDHFVVTTTPCAQPCTQRCAKSCAKSCTKSCLQPGRNVSVANEVFLGSVKLADGNCLLIHRCRDVVTVTLAVAD
jgi:hypothetical protein